MRSCAFFGHRDCPESVLPKIRSEVDCLISRGVKLFYVGNHGNFDSMVLKILSELEKSRKDITYYVVLSQIPKAKEPILSDHGILPNDIEYCPPRFSIPFCNRWMIAHSDVVICYCAHPFGNTAKYMEAAKKKKKTVVNLAKETTVNKT